MARFSCYWLMVIFYSLAMASKSLKEGYDNLQWGKRLLGRLLTTIAQVSPLDCAEECLIRPGCLSFNYRRAAIFCELNYENDSSSDTNITKEDGWIFSLRETWPMEITGACQDSNCSITEKCERKALGEFQCYTAHCHPLDLNITDMAELNPFSSDLAVDFGSRHKLSCKGEYNQTGNGLVTCLWNGTWSSINITCKKKENSQGALKNCRYSLLLKKHKWSTGKEECEKNNSYLLELQTKEEMEFVRDLLPSKTDDNERVFWLGGRWNGTQSIQFKHFCWISNQVCLNSTQHWLNWYTAKDERFPKFNLGEHQCMTWIESIGKWKHIGCEEHHLVICENNNC